MNFEIKIEAVAARGPEGGEQETIEQLMGGLIEVGATDPAVSTDAEPRTLEIEFVVEAKNPAEAYDVARALLVRAVKAAGGSVTSADRMHLRMSRGEDEVIDLPGWTARRELVGA